MSGWTSYDWQLLRGEPEGAHMHMALDEVLLAEVAAGRRPPTLRIWEWAEPSVVLGRFQSVRNEVDSEAAAQHAVTVVRRITGGGAMFNEPQNTITYSLYAPEALVKGLSFVESYAFHDDWVLQGLRSLGVEASYEPINDLTSPAGKIGGAAQTRRKGVVLHHAMLAYDIDASKMLQVLRIGREKLSDKGTVSAGKRVSPVRDQTQMERRAVIDSLVATFRSSYGLVDSELLPAERAAALELVEAKFATEEWLYLLP
jgi:lipoate-protein ligase A